jgi:hypothetical protein
LKKRVRPIQHDGSLCSSADDTVRSMPSRLHEALLELFRNRPELAPELLREALHMELPAYTEIRVESADFSQLAPTEYHADLVVLLVEGVPVLGIVVEVQLSEKRRKRFTWPLYLAALRAKIECDACVLVVTPNADIARRAAEPIRLGFHSVVTPLVVGPEGVPVVMDAERARRAPELGVLSVMAHGQGNVETAVKVALAAAAGLDAVTEERVVLYSDLIESALSEAARKAFFMLPEGYEFQSKTVREAFHKGKTEGNVEGRVSEKAADVLDVLDARGLSVTDEQRARILGCTDLDTLSRWLRRAVTVSSANALFE